MELRMRKHIALGSILALGVSVQAMSAEGFSYNNVDVAYVNGQLDFDGAEGLGNVDGDGFSLAGSAEIGENFFAFGSFGSLKLSEAGSSAKLKPITLGAGFHWALTPNLDLVSGLSFERLKISGGGDSVSDEGYGISLGLRGRVLDQLELSGSVKHIDIGDFGTDFLFNVGGRYYFTEAFAAGIDYTKYDDLKLDTWSVSLRYDFGG
jgi:hypothetical protein